jgi:hypothetical protein
MKEVPTMIRRMNNTTINAKELPIPPPMYNTSINAYLKGL